MSLTVDESDLPTELSAFDAVEVAYPEELARARDALLRGLPVLIECDKGLTPYVYKCLRDRVKSEGLKTLFLDGRPIPDAAPMGMIQTMLAKLRNAVRGAVDRRLVVLPHLDLLASTSGMGMTNEAREVIPLLYEDPNVLWLGFRDPSFQLPRAIERLFPHRISILGTPRHKLAKLVTQREARKLGRSFQPYSLYPYVSGVHAVALRTVLSSIEGEDYPIDPEPAIAQVRAATLDSDVTVPTIALHEDIGGYDSVKDRIQREILDVITAKSKLSDPAEIERVEKLIPRGIIFSGPPGTGKTLFAKAMASALGAAVQIVSGPELKSRWVGESEHRLRQVFLKARQSAPSLIIFDEIDSFASARGTFTGSGVEHSMVNQLLTEMDGFRANEMVFVVGTTNFLESLDAALLRPGRFEFHIGVPFPNAADREAILRIYDRKLDLSMDDEALDHAVKRTAAPVPTGGHYTGDHLYALCRTMARRRLRENLQGATRSVDVERALEENLDRPRLTADEERVVATHEAGHAIVAMHCEHAPVIDRISIRGDVAGALGAVSYADPHNRHVLTRAELYDRIAILFGGREAELAILGDLSLGAGHDLERATSLARAAVESYGMTDELVGDFTAESLSEATRSKLDGAVVGLLESQRKRARALIDEHREALLQLRDRLLVEKVIDRKALKHLNDGAA